MSRDILYTNDSLQTITADITQPDGTPQDLTGLDVAFALREEYSQVNAFGPNDGAVTSSSTGSVAYTCQPSDLQNLTPGVYRGQWVLTDSNNDKLHVDAGQFEVRSNL